jgi:hypothetical protein
MSGTVLLCGVVQCGGSPRCIPRPETGPMSFGIESLGPEKARGKESLRGAVPAPPQVCGEEFFLRSIICRQGPAASTITSSCPCEYGGGSSSNIIHRTVQARKCLRVRIECTFHWENAGSRTNVSCPRKPAPVKTGAGIQSHRSLLPVAGDVDSRPSISRGQACAGVTSRCFAGHINAIGALRVGARAYARRLATLYGIPTE